MVYGVTFEVYLIIFHTLSQVRDDYGLMGIRMITFFPQKAMIYKKNQVCDNAISAKLNDRKHPSSMEAQEKQTAVVHFANGLFVYSQVPPWNS